MAAQNGNRSELTFSEAMRLGYPMHEAMKEATRRALVVHDKLGEDVVTWRDGKPVVVPAAELLKEFDEPDPA